MFAAFTRYALTLTRPLIFIGAVFVGLALVSEPRATPGMSLGCFGYSSNVELNRLMCMLSPSRLFSGERVTLF